jgi:hypothetical protein
MKSLSWLVSSAFVFGIFSMSAAAQSAFLTVGDWSMVPIVNTTANQVTGIFAVKHATAISGDNLSVVAYRQSSSGTWTSQTWLDGPSATVAWLNTQGETASFDQIDDAPQPIPLPSQTPVTLSLASSKVIRSKKSSPTPSSDRPYSRCLSPRDIRPPTTRYPESTTKAIRVMSTLAMTTRF